VIRPVVAPVGTVAVICVLLLTVNVAFVPLNLTLVAPVKFVPAIVTEVPTGPFVGFERGDRRSARRHREVRLRSLPSRRALVTAIAPSSHPSAPRPLSEYCC
jgi:hypothetical protein